MKRDYLKPEAEYIRFYSEEDIALEGEKPSGGTGEGTGDDSWID